MSFFISTISYRNVGESSVFKDTFFKDIIPCILMLGPTNPSLKRSELIKVFFRACCIYRSLCSCSSFMQNLLVNFLVSVLVSTFSVKTQLLCVFTLNVV